MRPSRGLGREASLLLSRGVFCEYSNRTEMQQTALNSWFTRALSGAAENFVTGVNKRHIVVCCGVNEELDDGRYKAEMQFLRRELALVWLLCIEAMEVQGMP